MTGQGILVRGHVALRHHGIIIGMMVQVALLPSEITKLITTSIVPQGYSLGVNMCLGYLET